MPTSSRLTARETVQAGRQGSAQRYRFRSKIAQNAKPEFAAQRPFGAQADTASSLTKESAEASIEGTTIALAELVYFLAASLGGVVKTALSGGVFRYATTRRTFGVSTIEPLVIETGSSRQATALTDAVVSELGITVGDSAASVSGKLMGLPLDFDAHLSGSAEQTIAITGVPTSGTFTLTVLGQTTAALAYNATAAEVQTALNTKLGVGYTVVTGGPLPATGVTVRFPGAEDVVAAATAADTFDTGTVEVTVVGTGAGAELIPSDEVLAGQIGVHLGTVRPSLEDPLVNAESGFIVASAEYNLSDLFLEARNQNGKGFGPAAFNPNVEAKQELKVWLEADLVGLSIFRSYKAGNNTLYSSIVGVGVDGVGFIVNSRVAVSGIEDFGDKEGRFGFSVTFTPIHDDIWGGSTQIAIDCRLAAL